MKTKLKLVTSLIIIGIVFSLGCEFSFAQTDFWQQTNGPHDSGIELLAVNSSGHIFAGTFNFGIFRSTDNGDSWTQLNTGLTYSYFQSLAVNPSGHIFVGTWGDGILRSTDNGDSWTPVNMGLTDPYISSLGVNSSGHIFAGTDSAGVFRSKDNGDSWTPVNAGLTGSDIQSFAVNSSGHIFAGTESAGVFRSTDNGDSWTHVNTGLTNPFISSLAVNSRGHIFAGTYGGGVFRSTDNGESWSQVNSGLKDSFYILSLAVNSSGYVFAESWGKVFRSVQPTTDVNKNRTEAPFAFKLKQNYPNPFNPITTIEYQLPKNTHVILKILNIRGELIKALIDEEQSAGLYKVNWDAHDKNSNLVAGGLYFYCLQASGFSYSKTMVFVK